MFRVLIVDDEPLACDLVEEYLADFPQLVMAGRCLDGFAAVKFLQHEKVDLLFLDIQMPRLNGFDVLELLDEPPAVIFTTAFDQYAVQAFEAHALDYLLKPFPPERFARAVQKFLDQPEHSQKQVRNFQGERPMGNEERLVLKDGARIRIIPFDQLIRLEADGDYVVIHSKQGKLSKKQSLTRYAQKLPAKQFVRVHRSHLLNLQFIDRIDPYGKKDHLALLSTGERIPISRSGFERLRKVFAL